MFNNYKCYQALLPLVSVLRLQQNHIAKNTQQKIHSKKHIAKNTQQKKTCGFTGVVDGAALAADSLIFKCALQEL